MINPNHGKDNSTEKNRFRGRILCVLLVFLISTVLSTGADAERLASKFQIVFSKDAALCEYIKECAPRLTERAQVTRDRAGTQYADPFGQLDTKFASTPNGAIAHLDINNDGVVETIFTEWFDFLRANATSPLF